MRQQRGRWEGTLPASPKCLEPISDRTGKTISSIFKLPGYLIRGKMQNLLAELVVSVKGKVPVGVQRGSAAGSAPHTAGPRQLGTAGTGAVRQGRLRGPGQQHYTAPTQPPSPAYSMGCQAVFALPLSTTAQETEALSSYRMHLSSVPRQLRVVVQEWPAGRQQQGRGSTYASRWAAPCGRGSGAARCTRGASSPCSSCEIAAAASSTAGSPAQC